MATSIALLPGTQWEADFGGAKRIQSSTVVMGWFFFEIGKASPSVA
jgi:hypothetical protein